MTKEPCQPDRLTTRLKFEYDRQSLSFIISDIGGFVATVSSPNSLWEALLYETSNGEGALRHSYAEAKAEAAQKAKDVSPDMRAIERVMNENLRKERAAKRLATTPTKPKAKARYGDLSLDDLGDLFSE